LANETSSIARGEVGKPHGSSLCPHRNGIALFCAAAAAPVALRAAQVIETKSSFRLTDFTGLIADIAVASLFAAFLSTALWAFRRTAARAVCVPLLLLWTLFNYGNFEHIKALGTMANLANSAYLLDKTFLLGSALQVSHPALLTSVLLLSVLFFLLGSRDTWGHRPILVFPVLAAALLLTHAILPTTAPSAAWRQTHFFVENVRLSHAANPIATSADPIPGIFPGDLEGKPTIALGHEGMNVLVVILEGISGAYLDSIAEVQGFDAPRPQLPALDRKARESYTLANFVNHQRQTNRGVYSIVCGDLPKQTTAAPKMTEVGLVQEPVLCLPEALRRKGYETAFLQAAPLSFMGKDKFMPLAGFTQVHGRLWFRNAKNVGPWGVDDRRFFQESISLIRELQQQEKPWFLTLLTSGTHHPFTVPPDFQSPAPTDTFSHAVNYLNLAVEEFLAALEREKVGEDTLIIFTSDESFGIEGDLDDDAMMMAQAWGVLTVLLPSKEKQQVLEPFMQADVAISVLDYLGYTNEASQFRGRSFFRSYAEARPVPFANTYLRMTGALGIGNNLLLCSEDLKACRQYALETNRLIFASRKPVDPPTDGVDVLKKIVARATRPAVESPLGAREKVWTLIETPMRIILTGRIFRDYVPRIEKNQPLAEGVELPPFQPFTIFGNQYLSLAKGEQVDIEIELEIPDESTFTLQHVLRAVSSDQMPSSADYRRDAAAGASALGLGPSALGMRPRFLAKTIHLAQTERELRGKQTFSLHYSFGADKDFERLNALFNVWPTNREDIRLVIKKATLRISLINEDQDKTGLTIHHYSHAGGNKTSVADNSSS
jgi:hypothetical protein